MDIENMHPFCLPFSLCHDATSSSIFEDDSPEARLVSSKGNSEDKSAGSEEARIRPKPDTCPSPIGDLLERLDVAIRRSPPPHESLIHDSSDDTYHSTLLHLAMDISTSSDDQFGLGDMDQGEDEGERTGDPDHQHHYHEWHSSTLATHDCPLFSPNGSITASIRHRTRNYHHHHHHSKASSPCPPSMFTAHQQQVFQHVVDPIDIKSSPTLAQLNLNSNDDPTDGLWASGGGGSLSGAAGALAASSTSTLISSTTHLHRQQQASLSSLLSSTTSDLLASLPNQHHQHHCSPWASSSSPMGNISHLSSCAQNSILAEKNASQGLNQRHQSNQLNLNGTACSCQSHQQAPTCNNNQACAQVSMLRQGPQQQDLNGAHTQQAQLRQQRCSSPAPLVTSSSSPLVTSQSAQLNGAEGRAAGQAVDHNNKLKENIEYLTVLLCNGSKKMEMAGGSLSHQQQQPQLQQQQQQQQQQPISSSMVKSYSTLAQTLSTGPKLLERYAHGNQHLALDPTAHCGGAVRTPNEVLPQCVMQLNNNQPVLPSAGVRWSKPAAIESSVSAADSTAENQQHQHLANNGFAMDGSSARPPGDMKVLSSLLSSNKHTQPATGYPGASVWAMNGGAPVLAVSSPGVRQAVNDDAGNSVPVNGRPITLTPLVSNNITIAQRQQCPSDAKTKPRFAQPASPSTSSTTSSSGNLDMGSSSSSTSSSVGSSIASTPKKPRQSSSGSSSSSSSSSSGVPGGKQRGIASSGVARLNSLSTDCSLSSHDEGFSSQIDQEEGASSLRRANDSEVEDDEDDNESDIDSDDESFYGDYTNSDLIGASISDNPECKWTLNMGRTRRNGQRRFFWQYNVQSKGPKGARLCAADGAEDPFVLPEASDPVFSSECQIEGVKHSGKARRGDGNDLTPNPRKLLMIGLELKKLSKIINELAPVTDLPVTARNKTRKEKNKLASRACRLKKKAQHEANKIKLFGLQREHQQIVMAIYEARKTINKTLGHGAGPSEVGKRRGLGASVRELLEQCSVTVAGQTSDYVNSVLEKVVSGCIDGGLQT